MSNPMMPVGPGANPAFEGQAYPPHAEALGRGRPRRSKQAHTGKRPKGQRHGSPVNAQNLSVVWLPACIAWPYPGHSCRRRIDKAVGGPHVHEGRELAPP
eukprot:CAMPEP_0206417388 /NCGR_PEP_ID=MMETSP0294-20121207/37305_1 /ASSEMBLY_ACC=CAM_ASM_000327 /TAXON_ID=39354 /ORGANISM="Heterosigma akashiwo, Strain CCMP2393" /LENGTH=99 /DNA_ID=CAMNT_0053880209 /DNA_START=526 /DNA_END=822 /DNA_ORIENTATION=-